MGRPLVTVRSIPDGYHTLTPYLSVHDAHGLIDFLERAFAAALSGLISSPT